MSEKSYSFEEIRELLPKKVGYSLSVVGNNQEAAAIRKDATDLQGSYIVRLFKKGKDGRYEELDVVNLRDKIADYLKVYVSTDRLLKELVQILEADQFIDLLERIGKKPKVTVSVQKGSCVSLIIRGKRGSPTLLQLTP